jgi:rhamnose transport system permease protein
MGMLNVTGIVVSMVVGGLLIAAMVLPQYLRRLAAHFRKARAERGSFA